MFAPFGRIDLHQTSEPPISVRGGLVRFCATTKMAAEHGEVYWIASGARHYIGASKDVARRLRQHNRLLAGGAGQTAGGCWTVCCTVQGFASWVECLQFEMAFKRASRGGNRAQRRRALDCVIAQDRWQSRLVCVQA